MKIVNAVSSGAQALASIIARWWRGFSTIHLSKIVDFKHQSPRISFLGLFCCAHEEGTFRPRRHFWE